MHYFCFFFFKQKTAYEMRISDWSSDVCSSDLPAPIRALLLESPIKAPSPAPKAAPAPAPTAVFPPWDIWDGCVMFAHPPNMPATARQATAWLVDRKSVV